MGVIGRSLNAERAIRDYGKELAAKEQAANELTGVKGTRAKNELATFKENSNLSGLNADQASAYEAMVRARKGTVRRGTAFWNDLVAAEAEARKPQRLQK